MLTEQLEQLNHKAMVEMCAATDAAINSLVEINTMLTLNPDTTTLSTMQGLGGTQYLFSGQNAQRVLGAYSVANRNISTLGVYFEQLDYLITDRGSARGEQDVPYKLQRDFKISPAQWQSIHSSTLQNFWHLLPRDELNPPRMILSNVTLRPDRQKPTIISLIAIDMQRFMQPFYNMADVIAGDVWLVTDTGEYLTTAVDNRPLPVTLPDASAGIGVYYEDDLAVFTDRSQLTGWQLVAVTSKSLVLDKVSAIKNLIYLQIILCAIIGGALAYLLARHYYMPINKISKLLLADGNCVSEAGQSEICYVQNSLVSLIKEKQACLNTIDRQNRELKSSYLCRAVSGKLESAQALRDLCGLKLLHGGFALVGFYVQDFNMLFHNQNPNGPSGEDIGLISIIIQNVADEIFSEAFEASTFNLNGMMVALINLDATDKAAASIALATTCTKIMDIFTDTFGINVSSCISNIKNDFSMLPQASEELREVMEYVHVIGEERIVISYEEMRGKPELKMLTQDSSVKEQLLLDAVQNDNFQCALSMIPDVMGTYTASGLNSTRLVRIRIYALMASILDAFSQCKLDSDLVEAVLNENHFSYAHSAGEFQRSLTHVLTELSELTEENRSETTDCLTDRIKDFIGENYQNPNLGVSTIADQFHLNISYLSRAFKKQESQGLLDYIHMVRLTHVKEMLNGSDSIKDISSKSGYYNSLSMIRVFKRYEGVTPGRYREEHCTHH
ncbi:MAG: AraC family transcriptional regulator [Angelakisella sp.]